MFEKKPSIDFEAVGEYIVDFVGESGGVRVKLYTQPIGTVAYVTFKDGGDLGEPFLGPIHAYLVKQKLPKISFIHMHFEK